jgi:hypothetical protein
MGCKTECECLRSKRIGQSAAKFQHLTKQNYCVIMIMLKKVQRPWVAILIGASAPKWRTPKSKDMVNDMVYAHMKV